jgi:aminopeptidase 2
MEMFKNWAKGDKSGIHPDLRTAVFAIAIKNGGKEEVSPIAICKVNV